MDSTSIVQSKELRLQPITFKDNERRAYPANFIIPINFILTDVFIKVNNPVKGKKISVGIKKDTNYLVRGADVSSKGMVVPGVIKDAEGKIIAVTHGPGLCKATSKEIPIMSKARKTGDPDVKTGTRLEFSSYEKTINQGLAGEEIFVTIPEGCSAHNDHGGLEIRVYILGYQF